jgi:uncharacterized protein (TIGR00251 family)
VDVSDLYRTEGDDAVVLSVHVQPGAGRSAVVGRHGPSLKVRVAAAPTQRRANEATAALLAETFGVRSSAVELIGGETSRSKQFRVTGLDLDEFERQLEKAVSGGSGAGSGKGAGSARRR